MYRRILVALDGSPASDTVLREAIELARNQDAELLLFHVLDEWGIAAGDIAGVKLASGAPRLRESGGALLRDAEARVRHCGVPVTSVLLEEIGLSVGACIVNRAREWPADLIVCGTHGRRGVRRLLLGSVAEHIVRDSPVPVLMVRTPELTPQRPL